MKTVPFTIPAAPPESLGVEEAVAKLLDEELLVQKMFETDPQQGCEWLFRKYFAGLCNHAVRFVYTREVAEDLVSEVFCKFWTNQIYLTINTSYRAYLFKAVRYAAYNYVRWELSKKAEPRFDWDSVTTASDPVAIMQYEELYHTIDQTIHRLPPQCKRVFLMSRFENKKYQEIASELHVSVKAVEAHITKALHVLRKALKDGFF
jgi:RNA polymerase sigma-70 factor (family 1)